MKVPGFEQPCDRGDGGGGGPQQGAQAQRFDVGAGVLGAGVLEVVVLGGEGGEVVVGGGHQPPGLRVVGQWPELR
jgi:hypothetical protein